jgi:hypothetical protein
MHRSRRLAVLGVVLGAASVPLTFATLPPEGPVGGIDGQAWPAMLFLVPILLMAITGDRREAPPIWSAVGAAMLAAGCLAFAAVKVVDAWMAAADVSGSVGPGAWMLVVAAIVTAAGAALGFSRRI